MKTSAALVVSVAAVVAMVLLLMRDDTQVWRLVAVGAVGGVLAGYVRWGRRGALFGLAVGCVLGLAAPLLYGPFWLVFTLPPHPVYDL